MKGEEGRGSWNTGETPVLPLRDGTSQAGMPAVRRFLEGI